MSAIKAIRHKRATLVESRVVETCPVRTDRGYLHRAQSVVAEEDGPLAFVVASEHVGRSVLDSARRGSRLEDRAPPLILRVANLCADRMCWTHPVVANRLTAKRLKPSNAKPIALRALGIRERIREVEFRTLQEQLHRAGAVRA